MRSCRRPSRIVALGVATVALLACAACGRPGDQVRTGSGGARTDAVGAVTVDDSGCASGWVPPSTGPTTFTVTNNGTQVDQVELVGHDDRRVYADIEILPPGVSRPVLAQLSAGSYVWRCVAAATAIVRISPVGVVSGPPAAGLSYLPVGQDEMITPLVNFRSATQTGLSRLVADTDVLEFGAHAGSSTATLRTLWLSAHLDYERLGGAYDLFGSYDAKINGRVDGHPNGVADTGWTGFGRLEYALWHGQSTTVIRQVTDTLDSNVHKLRAAFPIENDNANDLTIRAHEILENALQFELNGHTDQGSHTNLATLRANLDGVTATLNALAPLFTTRSPALLAVARTDVAHLTTAVNAYHHADGSWVPVQSLSRAQRDQLDSLVSKTTEDLSTIPDVLHLDKHADE